MDAALLALIPIALIITGLTWYGARQTRTHAAMRDRTEHQALVEHTDPGE